MSETLETSSRPAIGSGAIRLTTPTGLQANAELSRRRRIVIVLNVVTWLAMMWVAARVLGAGGWTAVDVMLFLCFAAGTPWTVLGFWNALIGLWLLHFHKDADGARSRPTRPPAMTRRPLTDQDRHPHDPAQRGSRRAPSCGLRTVKAEPRRHRRGRTLSATSSCRDTNDPAVAAAEDQAIAAWRARGPPTRDRITYRRRTDNTGFKAGNVRDFCERWGKRLRADAAARRRQPDVRRRHRPPRAHDAGAPEARHPAEPRRRHAVVVRVRAHLPVRHAPRHALLHHGAGLVGRRLRTRSGATTPWCASSRSSKQCDLPILPGKPPLGGHVLSHDQVEATLMRRAGYEVRVLPVENGSWEENPPTMLDFAKRDVRWCQGNMQYLKLLDTPGLLSHEPLPARVGDPDVRRHSRLDADDRAAAGGCMGSADHRQFPGRTGHRPLHRCSSRCT